MGGHRAEVAIAASADAHVEDEQDVETVQLTAVHMPISTYSRGSIDELEVFMPRRKGRQALVAPRFLHGDTRDPMLAADDVLEDARFHEAGFQRRCLGPRMMRQITALQRHHDELEFVCPNESCVKAYRSYTGLINHINTAACSTTSEVCRVLSERFQQLSQVPPQREMHLRTRDHDSLPAYELDKKWWTPALVASLALSATPEELVTIHKIPHRMASPSEVATLEAMQFISPLTSMNSRGVRVFDADAILGMGQFAKTRARRMDELMIRRRDTNETGLAHTAHEEPTREPTAPHLVWLRCAQAKRSIAAQAHAYNTAILHQCLRDNRRHQAIETQNMQYSAARRAKMLSLIQSCRRPVRLFKEQGQDGVLRLFGDEYEKYIERHRVAPPEAASAPTSALSYLKKAKHVFDIPQITRDLVLRRAHERALTVPRIMAVPRPDDVCTVCQRKGLGEGAPHMQEMLTCSVCGGTGHPSCLRLPEEAVYKIRTYEWQCMDCKACGICGDSTDDDKLLFCDQCDRGYHTFCVGLHHTPRGRWVCEACGQCDSCGATDHHGDKWHHVTQKEADGSKRFIVTVCKPCHVQFDAGHVCPVCVKAYDPDKDSAALVQCTICERKLHQACEADTPPSDTPEGLGSIYYCSLCRGLKPDIYDAHHARNRRQATGAAAAPGNSA